MRSVQGHRLRQIQIRVELPTETPLRALDARHVLRPQLKGFGRIGLWDGVVRCNQCLNLSMLDGLPVSTQDQCREEAGDLRKNFPDPQKNHNNAETKPGQDTEGQCSNAELIGRLTTRYSASDFQIGGLLDHIHGSGSLFGIPSFSPSLMTQLPCCSIPRCNEAIVAEGLRVKKGEWNCAPV